MLTAFRHQGLGRHLSSGSRNGAVISAASATRSYGLAQKVDDEPKKESTAEVQKAAAERLMASKPKSSRPGARAEEMADAAAKVSGGKSAWQKLMVGTAVQA